MLNENIPHLGIEDNDDGTVTLEQDWSGNVDRVTLHPLQIRFLAERAGLLPASAGHLPTSVALARRLRVLRERIEELDDRLWAVPVYPPGAVSDDPDLWFSDATLEIAREFCADLDVEPSHAPVTRDSPVIPTPEPRQPALI